MTLEELRQICLSMPLATEDVKYESDLCFSIGKKIFCGTRIEGAFRTGIKCTEDDFAELIEREGIVPMPRLSTTFWIRIENHSALTMNEWKHYIQKSYDLIFQHLTKKERQQLGIE
jgi:predicted DNA-binding protein (MmcQ/YjbR family)